MNRERFDMPTETSDFYEAQARSFPSIHWHLVMRRLSRRGMQPDYALRAEASSSSGIARKFRHFETQPAKVLSPGQVFTNSMALLFGGDKKTRPYLLLSRLESDKMATLAHMTSKETERDAFDAPTYMVCSRRPSYVALCRLIFCSTEDLNNPIDDLGGHLPRIRPALASALGIGTGTCTNSMLGSMRGRVAAVAPNLSSELGFQHGVVLTEHAYSARRRWQVLVPLIDALDGQPDPSPHFVELHPGEVDLRETGWAEALGMRQPVLDTTSAITLSEAPAHGGSPRGRNLARQILYFEPQVIDEGTLMAVEDALCENLMIPNSPRM